MGDAAELTLGFGAHEFTIAFALFSLTLQIFIPYRRYSRLLKWLTLALFAYVAVVFMVRLNWRAIAIGLVVPHIEGRAAATTIVALFGTTISPYLFFWQSAQEVEDVAQDPDAHSLMKSPSAAPREFRRMMFDTLMGMAFSNIVALAIIIATAATLHAAGKTSIDTAADAARALQPVAGHFAFVLFSLGIIGTGLLAVPVLAGSAAFAVGEAEGWECGLEHRPWEAKGFYAIIGLATLLGIAIDWSPLDPIKALFWSAVINGVVAVPIMVAMMIVVSRRQVMGRFVASPLLLTLGWVATATMGAAAVAMMAI